MGEVQQTVFNKPTARFIATMAVFTGVVLPLYLTETLGRVLAPLSRLTAQVTVALIHWTGQEAVREATYVYHPGGFAYEIQYRCTAFLPVMFLVVAILSFSATGKKKALGLAVGVPGLVLLNLVRLVHLFYLGVNKPALFPAAHSIVWPAVTILAVLGLWSSWTGLARRRDRVRSLEGAEAS